MGPKPVRAWMVALAASAAVGSAVLPSAAKDEGPKPKSAEAANPAGAGKAKDPAAAAAEMAAWEKAMRVGPEHQKVTAMAGTWDAVVVAYMPDGTTAESKGKETAKAILGGRFLESQFEGEMMGMPYSGRGLLGFDNLKRKYVMTWADSMSTAIMSFEGTADDAAKTMTLTAECPCPDDGKTALWRAVTTISDDAHHTFDMYMTKAGQKEMKVMTIKYARAAGGGGKPTP